MKTFAELIEVENMPLEELKGAVAEGHYYWEDRKGNKLGPYQLLQDWEIAQKNEDWTDHVATVRRADLTNPIWITADGHVFNGIHRLTKAFLDGKETIKVKKFAELPEDAKVN